MSIRNQNDDKKKTYRHGDRKIKIALKSKLMIERRYNDLKKSKLRLKKIKRTIKKNIYRHDDDRKIKIAIKKK